MESKNNHVAQECEDLKAKLDKLNNDIYSHLVDDCAHLNADYGHLVDDYAHLEICNKLSAIYEHLLNKFFDFIDEYEYNIEKCKNLLLEEEVKQLKRDIDEYKCKVEDSQHEIDYKDMKIKVKNVLNSEHQKDVEGWLEANKVLFLYYGSDLVADASDEIIREEFEAWLAVGADYDYEFIRGSSQTH